MPELWPQERVDALRALLADGVRYREIAERLGVTRNAVISKANRIDIARAATLERNTATADEYRARVEKIRKLAKQGKTLKDIVAAVGLHEKTVRNLCGRHGIKYAKAPRPKKADIRPPRPVTIEEWIARHGRPPKFEAGTLDQILADTFASVGKPFKYSAGKGASWTPYVVAGKRLNLHQTIALANKIRAKQGKPLLSEPRRRAA